MKLNVLLANEGGTVAEDIHVFMQFPDGFALLSERQCARPPSPPQPPSRPRTRAEKLEERSSGDQWVTLPSWLQPQSAASTSPPANVSPPKITKKDGYVLEFHVQRLKHGFRQPLGVLCAILPSFESAYSFRLMYKIAAASVPQAIEGELHVVVNKAAWPAENDRRSTET
ncbi:MAG TPA: hypothetical protein VM537_22660 [Anaerolineae bacterium]|nr:hypothetical protein [Anaerolineae bacterium]